MHMDTRQVLTRVYCCTVVGPTAQGEMAAITALGREYLLCRFHMLSTCDDRLRKYSKQVQDAVMADLRQLINAMTLNAFEIAEGNFLTRWQDKVPEFIQYYKQEWQSMWQK